MNTKVIRYREYAFWTFDHTNADIRRTLYIPIVLVLLLFALSKTFSQSKWTSLEEGVVYSDSTLFDDGDTIILRTVKNQLLGIEFRVELNSSFEDFYELLEGPVDSSEWTTFQNRDLGIRFRYPPQDSVAVDLRDSSISLFQTKAESAEELEDSAAYPYTAMTIYFTRNSFMEKAESASTFSSARDSIWDIHGDAGFSPAAYIKGYGWLGLYGETANMEELGSLGMRGLAWRTYFFAMKTVSAGRSAVFNKTEMRNISFLGVVSSFAVWR